MLLSSKDYVIVVQAETALVIVHTRVHVRHVTAERCCQEPSLALGLLRGAVPHLAPSRLASPRSPRARRSKCSSIQSLTHSSFLNTQCDSSHGSSLSRGLVWLARSRKRLDVPVYTTHSTCEVVALRTAPPPYVIAAHPLHATAVSFHTAEDLGWLLRDSDRGPQPRSLVPVHL